MCGCELEGCGYDGCTQFAMTGEDICDLCRAGDHL